MTAVVSALQFLIAPLQWQGLVVTLVPQQLVELLQAPVPFICGVMSHNETCGGLGNVSSSSAILVLTETSEILKAGLGTLPPPSHAPVSLAATEALGSGYFRLLPETQADLPSSPDLEREIATARSVLLSLRFRVPAAGDRVPAAAAAPHPHLHYLNHMTTAEQLVVARLQSSLSRHVQHLAGSAAFQPHLWKTFVRPNPRTAQLEFHPLKYLEHSQQSLEFLEILVNTQHFGCFLDARRGLYEGQEGARRRLGAWLLRVWRRKRGSCEA